MFYTKFNTSDGIEFIPLKEPEPEPEPETETETESEPEQKQKDIKSQIQNNLNYLNNSNNELINSDTTCCICLENNNSTSKQLNCRCKIKIHKKCIEEMCKKNIKKCPLCSDTFYIDVSNASNASNASNVSEIKQYYEYVKKNLNKFFLLLFITISVFTYFINIFYILPNVIFYESLNNYCNDIYKKCE